MRFIAVVGPLLLLVAVEISRQLLLIPKLSPWAARLLILSVALVLLVLFYELLLERLEKLEHRLHRQNRELLELHAAALVVTADISLDTVLQTVVERACALLGTLYGALTMVDQAGQITSFVTSGIGPDREAAIGAPPRGLGLLGVPLFEGQTLRVDEISKDPRSVGVPPGHPSMHSLLAVPVTCRAPHHGILYLSEKEGGGAFSQDDEDVLVRFAEQAAIAIDNAHLHSQMKALGADRERLRIAHEMHDGLAQVLAYVNVKAQVVREYMRQGKVEEAQTHLDEFAEAARNIYGDVRQQILDLRTILPEEGGLPGAISDYASGWAQQISIQLELAIEPVHELPIETQTQLLRILQEMLANVRKHAQARWVRVTLANDGEAVFLLVSDDGVGFEPKSDEIAVCGRFGLKTMAERAAAIGATFVVTSKRGKGTRVMLTLPGGKLRTG
ncbi:MAG: GAF domain-containing sensor histidine kinase [Acidobacteriota bacterium]